MLGRWLFIGAALFSAPVLGTDNTAPMAKPLWTISNDDCVGLDTDGPAWLQCGFQDWTINADQSRILTVSNGGKVQLWDGEGKQVALIEWRDGWMKAGGHPNAWVKIIGNTGVAIVNQSELIVFDMATGAVRLKHPFEARRVSELRSDSQGRLFARVDDMEWRLSYREISLVDGSLGPKLTAFPDELQIAAKGKLYSDERLNKPPLKTAKDCWFLDQSTCVLWPTGSRTITVLDRKTGAKRPIKTAYKRTPYTFIRVVRAGPELVASVCSEGSSGYPSTRDCDLFKLETGQKFHSMKAGYAVPYGALDESGKPEVRMLAGYENGAGYRAIRVGMDGKERLIGDNFAGTIRLLDGGMIVGDREKPDNSHIIGPDGTTLSIIPVSPHSFGYHYQAVPENNLLSTAQKKWLVSVGLPPPAAEAEADQDMEINNVGLTMFDIGP